MANFVGTIINLFLILAGFAGVIGGILLIFAGEWSLLFYLIIVSVIAPFAMTFVMMPGLLLAYPAESLINKGYKFLPTFLAWLISLYLGLVFACWSAYIFFDVMNTTETFWGGVFASFGTAISPIIYMLGTNPIEDEVNSVNHTLTVLTAQISLLVMVLMGVLYGGTFYEIGIFYVMTYAVLSIIQRVIMHNLMFKENN